MRVLIATGGTGGHIYPALSLAKALKEENSANEFYFIGSKNRMEATEIPQAGYAYQGIDVIQILLLALEIILVSRYCWRHMLYIFLQ